jgi:hypothetical protein
MEKYFPYNFLKNNLITRIENKINYKIKICFEIKF